MLLIANGIDQFRWPIPDIHEKQLSNRNGKQRLAPRDNSFESKKLLIKTLE